MKKEAREPAPVVEDDMLPEYDFRGGVRGKHAQSYGEGHTVRVRQASGATLVQHFALTEGTILLEPDVREYFPDSQAVNRALRGLITLIPAKRKARKQAQTGV